MVRGQVTFAMPPRPLAFVLCLFAVSPFAEKSHPAISISEGMNGCRWGGICSLAGQYKLMISPRLSFYSRVS